MRFLNSEDWKLVKKIDCDKCGDKNMCDQVKYECPKVEFSCDKRV
jgi:hypothetical protein